MTTRMTINGVSTCAEAGTEKYERFQSGIGRRRRTLVQYDYRHTDGELFACVCRYPIGNAHISPYLLPYRCLLR